MHEVGPYKVVPLRLSPDAIHCHDVYMRENFIKNIDPTKPEKRTLLLLNIPPYVTEKSLHSFFSRVGKVETIYLSERTGRDEIIKWCESYGRFYNGKSPFKFKVAFIVFKTSCSVRRALQLDSFDLFSVGTGESLIESGLGLWHLEYQERILDEDKALKDIEKYMEEYDQRELEAQNAAKTSEADVDGWVTVGKKGKNAGFEQKESVIGRLEEKIEKSKEKKELSNFYTFQIREHKMKNIVDLRKKFEEDKQKIEVLKQSRRFRPF